MRHQELEDTVFILNSLANKTKNFVVAALETATGISKPKKGEKPSKEDTLIHAALTYSLVQVSAFIDEWERQFVALKGKGIEADRIVKVENIVEPALTVIYSFTGLRDYRNWALAHNLRIKSLGYANALRGNHIASLKVPITLFDYQLVADCVTICAEMVRVEFKEYYMKPSDFIEANAGLNLPVGITNAEYNQQKEVIKTEVARRWKTLSPDTWKEFSKGGDVREP